MKIQGYSLWLIAILIIASLGVFGYYWAFSSTKVSYATATVERGDVESTVVAAGIVQPVQYVDVGAQTSGNLQSLKVKRGDQVEKGQLLAVIDPILANTALKSASAAFESMAAQRSLKQAQLALASVIHKRNEEIFAQGEGGVSANDRDIALANYNVAFADVASITAQLKQSTAAIETAKVNLNRT